MKKKAIATKKSKTKPAMKRKLGMGLSSLLSKDEELASVIKSKIKTKLDQGNKDSKLNVKKGSVSYKTSRPTLEDPANQGVVNFKAKDSLTQTSIPIQYLISGKYNFLKNGGTYGALWGLVLERSRPPIVHSISQLKF